MYRSGLAPIGANPSWNRRLLFCVLTGCPVLFYHAQGSIQVPPAQHSRIQPAQQEQTDSDRWIGEVSLSIGIIGLPNVGKSTLLNALSQAEAEASNYPFCTIDCNQGVVPVPDGRLERLVQILQPKEVIPATVKYIDIAGLVEGASRGEGLGNKFLHHVREANVLAHVLRCFENEDVSHVQGEIDPVRDLEIVETELLVADLERVESRIAKEEARAKAMKKEERKDLEFLEHLKDRLSKGRKTTVQELTAHEQEIMQELQLLTSKPSILVLNAGEDDQRGEGPLCSRVKESFPENDIFVVSARIEQELSELPPGERKEFMKELGLSLEARRRFIEKCHELLGLIRYYTTAHEKLQAWSIQSGTVAPAAAGKIHTDMEKGFIRAEVMSFEDLSAHGSRAEVQHHGLLRTEGHDYIIRDGDVVHFLFNR
jgi:GTP-binding protein YchF